MSAAGPADNARPLLETGEARPEARYGEVNP
jgi:hypothetical protein